MYDFFRYFGGFIFIALLSVLVFGCSNDRLKGLAPVNGQVLYKDSPLVKAIVSFGPEQGHGMLLAALVALGGSGKFADGRS